MENLENFLTLENAVIYNNSIDKLIFIADSLDISAIGQKVLNVETKLMNILINNNIYIN